MSRFQKIRNSVDGRLDRWEARATAMESHLSASREQALDRVEAAKQSYLAAVDKAKTKVESSKTLAAEQKQQLQTQLDEARVQVALGKAESRDAYAAQAQKIHANLKDVEANIDREMEAFDAGMDEALDKMAREMVVARNALDAEIEAASTTLGDWKEGAQAKAADMKTEISGFKAKIAEKRGKAAENLDAFNDEFSEGWKRIGNAFRNLK